jgi:queuine tRNA-ribosyltransferase
MEPSGQPPTQAPSPPAIKFQIVARSARHRGRVGVLSLPHGEVETPAFMPVGTKGGVKTLTSEEVESLGYRLLLCNTYHLAQRPGAESIQKLGGLHSFLRWRHGILTDSGGFQVMSLASYRQISPEGVLFRSPIDGALLKLTPESAMDIQRRLGVDIAMALDVCPKNPAPREEAERSVELTLQWAERTLKVRSEDQAVFGIIQGGTFEDLRIHSTKETIALPFDGYAIGGVSVGEDKETQRHVIQLVAPLLPEEKPRYLMGMGTPQDIIFAVEQGIDLLDCVLPTRLARHHALFTLKGVINILSSAWTNVEGPPDPDSVFPPLQGYSAAYLRHLFHVQDPLAQRLATLHNLAFYARLMEEIRQAIRNDTWEDLKARYAQA